jgi:hypothetical protein
LEQAPRKRSRITIGTSKNELRSISVLLLTIDLINTA